MQGQDASTPVSTKSIPNWEKIRAQLTDQNDALCNLEDLVHGMVIQIPTDEPDKIGVVEGSMENLGTMLVHAPDKIMSHNQRIVNIQDDLKRLIG